MGQAIYQTILFQLLLENENEKKFKSMGRMKVVILFLLMTVKVFFLIGIAMKK